MTTPLQRWFYGILGVGGGLAVNVVTKTTAYTLDSGSVPDHTVFCNLSAAHVMTLPPSTKGRVVRIKDIAGNAATYNITITPASGTVEGGTTYVLNANYGSVDLTCDGTNWWVTGSVL
jgi:hypothetical protein